MFSIGNEFLLTKMAEPEAFNVIYLPEHILMNILSYMSYSEISRIREICQTFNRICSRELTKAFVRVDRLHSQIQKNIKSQLPRKESERRNHALSRFVDVLSALETRLSLLSMTYTKYIDLELCCFIPGMVLDELYQLLHRLQNTESQPPRAYDLLQSLRDLSTMAMEHFEEYIVPLLKAQMTERSQTLFFSPHTGSASSSSSPLHSSIIPPSPNPLDMSGMSMMDCSWPMPLSVVSSPWRRTPLKLDVQRMQSQMQMHSAAIATMTKEYREQKVKIGEQSRIIAEQERLLLEQSRLILELKAHMVAQEKNQDTLAAHITTLTGKVVHLPETLAWDHSLWDASPHLPEPQGCSFMAGADLHDFTDRGLESRKRLLDLGGDSNPSGGSRDRTPDAGFQPPQPLHHPQGKVVRYHNKLALISSTATSTDEALSVEQFMYQANELHQSLSSKCSTKRLLAQIALAIQRIAADHSLPVCLEECPSRGKGTLDANSGGGSGGGSGDGGSDDAKSDLLSQLTSAQHQLSNFNEEHVGCGICVAEDPRITSSLVHFSFPTTTGSRGGSEPLVSSFFRPSAARAANQGLVNRAQELYNRLNGLIQEKGGPPAKPACAPTGADGEEKGAQPGGAQKGKGKGLLKRKRSVTKAEADKPETNSSPKYRKCRRRL